MSGVKPQYGILIGMAFEMTDAWESLNISGFVLKRVLGSCSCA